MRSKVCNIEPMHLVTNKPDGILIKPGQSSGEEPDS